MSFMHAGLLAGLAFALIPILIHISGRRQPKPILFPALQFVQTTKIASARGWSVKRWLLLLLRIAMLMLLALALASPRVHQASFASWISIGVLSVCGLFALIVTAFAFAGRGSAAVKYTSLAIAAGLLGLAGSWSTWVIAKGPTAPMQSSTGPVAAVVIVDNSPTMDYRFENQTRLDKAKEFARWIVGRLNAQSMIAVLTGSFGERLQLGHASAEQSIDRLQIQGTPVDLLDRIRKAIELVRESKLERHEIYVITDFATNSWVQSESSIRAILGEGEPVLLQIVDVGTKEHINWGIDQVRISQDVAQVGATIQVDAIVKSAKNTSPQQVILELSAEQNEAGLPRVADGKLVTPKTKVIDRKIVDSQGKGDIADFSFQITNLPLGTTNYHLRLGNADPLSLDAQYAFTVEGIESGRTIVIDASIPTKVGAVAPSKPSDVAELLALMLDPTSRSSSVIRIESMKDMKFDGVSVIALSNPPNKIPPDLSKTVEDFVNAGGSLIVVLGDSIDPKRLSDTKALEGLQSLLPGRLARLTRRPQRDVYLENLELSHGMWGEFGREIQTVPWGRFAVIRHWDIEDLKASAKPLARYTLSGYPAIIEEVRGEGRILTFTTPIPDLERADHVTWNELTTSADSWVAFGTMLGADRYLQSMGEMRRNFDVGETAFVEWSPSGLANRYELFHPDGTEEQIKLNGPSLLYGFTQKPGLYRLRAMSAQNDVRGFAVHMPLGATSLERIDLAKLDEVLGEGNYVVADNKEGLRQSIGEGRYGRDMAPFLLLVLAGLFLAEQAMSQNFYAPRNWKWSMGRS